jgi:hypothetical protein
MGRDQRWQEDKPKNGTVRKVGHHRLKTYFHECLGIVTGPLSKITAIMKLTEAGERRG